MPRALDLVAVVAVAVVVLLPRPSIEAHPALDADPIELDRVAEQQDALARSPDDVDAALALSDSFLAFERTDWAIATVARFASRGDARVHLRLATAHAERLEPAEAAFECDRADQACAKATCTEGVRVKVRLLRAAMKSLLDGNIDPRKDPKAAKEAVYKALHPGRYNIRP